jgi:hypothetical protein
LAKIELLVSWNHEYLVEYEFDLARIENLDNQQQKTNNLPTDAETKTNQFYFKKWY